MKYTIILFMGYCIGLYLYHNYLMPDRIEQRAKELNLLEYDSKKNTFVIKDSVCIDNYDLEYLKYGKINH